MLNTSVLQGRLVADPELKKTQNGISVTSFTLAVPRDFKQAGETVTDFIDIVAWRHTAEFVCKYFNKGDLMLAQGSLQTRSYEDKNGNKRKAFEVVADKVNFCGGKTEGKADELTDEQKKENLDNIRSAVEDDEDLPF